MPGGGGVPVELAAGPGVAFAAALAAVDGGEVGPGAGPGCVVHAARTSNPRTDSPARRLIVWRWVSRRWYATVSGWLSVPGSGQWSAPVSGWLSVSVPV